MPWCFQLIYVYFIQMSINEYNDIFIMILQKEKSKIWFYILGSLTHQHVFESFRTRFIVFLITKKSHFPSIS